MNTFAKQGTTNVRINTKPMTLKVNAEFWNNLEAKRFAIVPMLLLVIACAGGIAAAFGPDGSTIQLAMIAFPTIISLALVLGVATMRAIVYTSVLAVLLDILVLLF